MQRNSWVYTLGKTEQRRSANAFNIDVAGVIPILRGRVVRYIKKWAAPVASYFENASRFVPVTHQAPGTTVLTNLRTELPAFVQRRVTPFVAQQSFDYMGMSTPALETSFFRNMRIGAKKLGIRGQVWQLWTRISRRKYSWEKTDSRPRIDGDGFDATKEPRHKWLW